MVYLRNATKVEQWLLDPATGIKRQVEAGGLAQVTPEVADATLRQEPDLWVRVVPISLPATRPDTNPSGPRLSSKPMPSTRCWAPTCANSPSTVVVALTP